MNKANQNNLHPHPGDAQFAEALQLSASTVIASKAASVEQDACSGFQGTGLDYRLLAVDIRRLFFMGRTPFLR